VVGSRNNQEDERQVSEKYHFLENLYRKRRFRSCPAKFFQIECENEVRLKMVISLKAKVLLKMQTEK
jgi:hypothetical protein